MNWSTAAVPSRLNVCNCGSDSVEVRPDGFVHHYRCAGCHSSLGDMPMGPEL